MKRILYIQHTDPAAYPPLLRSSRLLAERGWRVQFLGTMVEGAARELGMEPHPGIHAELMPCPGRGRRHLINYGRFLARCRAEIQSQRPTVVYCSDLKSYPIGLWASRAAMITVLHEHDTPSEDGRRINRLLLAARRAFARRATVCVLPQSERAHRFRRATGANRVLVAHNCPLTREVCDGEDSHPSNTFLMWYHGSIGPTRLSDAFVRALTRLPSAVRLEFAGYETIGSRGYIDHLLCLARELGVADRVVYHGALPLHRLLKASTAADVGLVAFAHEFGDPMVGASVKPFDYLACGLPLIVNRTSEWEDFFGAKGVAVACHPEDPNDIARAILGLCNSSEQRKIMAERGRKLIRTQWNYEVQFSNVLSVIEGRTTDLIDGWSA